MARVATPFQPLPSVEITDLIKAIGADEFRLVQNAAGKYFVHVLNSKTTEYFPIGVSSKISTNNKGEDLVAEMIRDYSIFYGESDPDKYSGNAWFTFGPKPTSRPPMVTVSIEKLMKGVQRTSVVQ